MDHPDRVVQDEGAFLREVEGGSCESAEVRWRWGLAMTEVGLQRGVEYREGEGASGVYKQGSHTSPVVVDGQGGQLGAWTRSPGDEAGSVATKTPEWTRQGRSEEGRRLGDRPYKINR